MDGIKAWDEVEKLTEAQIREELAYILQTISGPWEFISYTCLIEGVTRAFTHQLVRHRVGTSFAQESLRIADKGDFQYLDETDDPLYASEMEGIKDVYNELVSNGVPTQKARGILPTNILTNIMMGINLRALNTMMNTRLCVRAAGEFQKVALQIRDLVLGKHPWAEPALLPFCLEWGACKFQAFDKCPIKRTHPWLNKPKISLNLAKETWERVCGFSPQPE